MNRREAVQQVADHLLAILVSGDLEESTGVSENDLSDADADRLGWAVQEVARRLHSMGGRRLDGA